MTGPGVKNASPSVDKYSYPDPKVFFDPEFSSVVAVEYNVNYLINPRRGTDPSCS